LSIVGNLEKRGRSICRVQQDGERGRKLRWRSQAAASLQSYVAMPMKVLLVAMSDLLCGDITRSQVRNLRHGSLLRS